MEVQNALHLLIKLVHKSKSKVFLEYILSDVASLQALLKHKTPTSKKRKLPHEIPEPSFLADPGHRTKTVFKPYFALVKLKKSESLCSRVNALRFKKYILYMLHTNCDKSIEESFEAAQAVIEHVLDNHQICNEK